MGGWFRKEIKTVDDFKGLKMRIGGWAGKTLAKLGAIPQQIAGGDIYPALEKGTIDATEWVGPYDDEKLGFYKVAKYYYYPGWWEGGTALHFFINLDKWNALPKSLSVAARRQRPATPTWTCRRDTTPAIRRRSSAWSPHGTQLRPFSTAIMEACLKASNEVNAETSAANADFKKIYELQMAFRNDEIPVVAGRGIHLRLLHDPPSRQELIGATTDRLLDRSDRGRPTKPAPMLFGLRQGRLPPLTTFVEPVQTGFRRAGSVMVRAKPRRVK